MKKIICFAVAAILLIVGCSIPGDYEITAEDMIREEGWEIVSAEGWRNRYDGTIKKKVEGGWLYKSHSYDFGKKTMRMVFVPDMQED